MSTTEVLSFSTEWCHFFRKEFSEFWVQKFLDQNRILQNSGNLNLVLGPGVAAWSVMHTMARKIAPSHSKMSPVRACAARSAAYYS